MGKEVPINRQDISIEEHYEFNCEPAEVDEDIYCSTLEICWLSRW